MRMSVCRCLTNAFSNRIENHVHTHFVWYNYCHVHVSLGTMPAVAAGLAGTLKIRDGSAN